MWLALEISGGWTLLAAVFAAGYSLGWRSAKRGGTDIEES